VQPRASRSGLAGESGGVLKLKIAAPPVDGKANQECRRFLAELLGIPRSAVEIVVGEASKTKVIRFRGVTEEQVLQALGF